MEILWIEVTVTYCMNMKIDVFLPKGFQAKFHLNNKYCIWKKNFLLHVLRLPMPYLLVYWEYLIQLKLLQVFWDYLLKLLVIEWNLCTSVSRAKFSFIAYTTFYSPIFFPPVSLQTATLKELQRGHANLTFFILFSRLNDFNTFLLCAYSNTNVVRHINVQDLGIYWLKGNFFI